MLLRALALPKTVVTEFGTVTLTHEAFAYVINGVGVTSIKMMSMPGVMVPGYATESDPTPDPVFKGYEDLVTEKYITGKALAPLRNAKGGKVKDDFRLSDIRNLLADGIAP